ncbi:hypothetical protein A3Q41_00001 [Rhodococcoides fascians]|uniref:Uncharacterized protein n=1 Tax=Rhodococcoides fascians TaxID=1828 RepID=A0A143QDR3_RHOFA|nr:hypothetical protein A3Q41_00001 [Rhodococcus fascians]
MPDAAIPAPTPPNAIPGDAPSALCLVTVLAQAMNTAALARPARNRSAENVAVECTAAIANSLAMSTSVHSLNVVVVLIDGRTDNTIAPTR